MRHIHYYIIVLACMLLGSCMEKDWDIPATDGSEYGNQGVAETNVITIAQLKQKYASALLTNENYKQIDESMQIKGVVTGNDIEGNIYNQIGIEDGTGSVIICIAQGGLYGQLTDRYTLYKQEWQVLCQPYAKISMAAAFQDARRQEYKSY